MLITSSSRKVKHSGFKLSVMQVVNLRIPGKCAVVLSVDTRELVSFPACHLLLGPFLQSGHGSSIALFLVPLFSSSCTPVLLLQGPWVHTVRGQEEPPPCSQFWCQSCVFVCVNIAIFSGCRYVRFWRLDLFSTRGDARAVEVHKVLASLLFLRHLKFHVHELWSTMREG